MLIRKAMESDYEQLMILYNEFVKEDRYSSHDNDSFRKVIQNPNNYIFVAEDKNKLIGFASVSIREVVRYPKPIAELDELYIVEKCRKQGVGKDLLNKIEKIVKKRKCYRIYIESRYDHKSAHKFYERLGYQNYGYHFIKNL